MQTEGNSQELSSRADARKIMWAMASGLIIGLLVYFSKEGMLGERLVIVGNLVNQGISYLQPIGALFIKLLRMVVVPLVLASVFMAVVNLGSPKALGNLGLRTLLFYFTTTAIAVFVGLILVNIIQPGVGASLAGAGLQNLSATMAEKVTSNKGLFPTIIEVLMDAIPANPFEALAKGTILQVIVFALLFSAVALFHSEKSRSMINFFQSLESMTLVLTHWVLKIAPVGIFVLMLGVMAGAGLAAVTSLSKYMLTVIVGLMLHGSFLLILGSIRSRKSPVFILRAVSQSLTTAFSTASSAAALPVTISNVEDNLGVKQETAKFVLPLGATINMDGTALYESVAALFIAQAYGITLGFGQQFVVFLTASLAAIGAAAIPGAGLITMSIVLTAVGLPLEGIGLILAVDRILDMFRTTINVFGDITGTLVVDSFDNSKKS